MPADQRTSDPATSPAEPAGLRFIAFEGEEFGPYQSEREAMLFAIDAAHKLSEQGEETQVLRTDETGGVSPVWTFGLDSYPPAPQVAS